VKETVRGLSRIALAACVAAFSVATIGAKAGAVRARTSSTWYWQNPLPRAYSMQAISCPSVDACVTVGQGGSIMTTLVISDASRGDARRRCHVAQRHGESGRLSHRHRLPRCTELPCHRVDRHLRDGGRGHDMAETSDGRKATLSTVAAIRTNGDRLPRRGCVLCRGRGGHPGDASAQVVRG
jgi:hypothetical protein